MADPRIAEAIARLPDYFGNHVLVSLLALALGLATSLPLAIFALRRPAFQAVLLAVASIVQTVPGLALLALFYPLLLGLASLSQRWTGFAFSALGLLPAVLALALYSMLPVVRNTITGICQIDPAVKRAALGVGMTPRQSLWLVELPLAVPTIMAGVRTAAVWVIGTATLSTPIGQTSLGNYIFTGLQSQNWVFVLFGCALAAALALAVDQLLLLLQLSFARRSSPYAMGAVAGLGVIGLLALSSLAGTRGGYVVGGKPFAEQYILTALIGERLRSAGLPVTSREGLGSAIALDALVSGDIDVYVDYSGTLWANHLGRTDVRPSAEVLAGVATWLKERHGARMLGALGFENAYALAMSKHRAQSMGIATLEDLAGRAGQLSIAGDLEFFGRPEWATLRKAYGLQFREQRQMQAELMYPAAAAGEVDVISAYTSDGRLDRYELVVLADPRHAIPPYDAILLISPRRANDATLIAALGPLVSAIPTEAMRQANRQMSDGASAIDAARWLESRIGR